MHRNPIKSNIFYLHGNLETSRLISNILEGCSILNFNKRHFVSTVWTGNFRLRPSPRPVWNISKTTLSIPLIANYYLKKTINNNCTKHWFERIFFKFCKSVSTQTIENSSCVALSNKSWFVPQNVPSQSPICQSSNPRMCSVQHIAHNAGDNRIW